MTPSWYPAWRHEAVHLLDAKADALRENYGLSRWPRWDYDLDAGEIVFSEDGKPRLRAQIQIVGSTGSKDWLWAWANEHWPEPVRRSAERVKAFGLEHSISELTEDYLEDENLNSLGWELAAVAARVTDALGAYRPPSDTGALFLLITSAQLVS